MKKTDKCVIFIIMEQDIAIDYFSERQNILGNAIGMNRVVYWEQVFCE